ncbi:MAG: universal stress protein [Nitrospiraceae bacterium]
MSSPAIQSASGHAAQPTEMADNARQVTMGSEHSLVKRILFPTDFSSCADHAEAYVAFLAKAYGATVTVVHVLEIYEGMYVTTIQDHSETDKRLADTVRRLTQPPVLATSQQRAGIPDVVICEAAAEDQADLIMLGTHGRTGLQHILLGSTAERVLTIAPCPVMTVREPKGRITCTHVVVPIDLSGCSFDALEYGIQIAKDLGAALTLLHVLEPTSYGIDLTFEHAAEGNKRAVTSQLASVVNTIRSHGVSAQEVIRGGVPTDAILEFIRTSDCDLIVMGTHGRRGIAHVMRGSVAEAVLRRAPCPVLAVKIPKFPPGHQRMMPQPTEAL